MKKNAGKAVLIMAAALAVFAGKGSEAKAYEVVGGTAYMTWDEYEAAERRGGISENCVVSSMFEKRDDTMGNLMYYLTKDSTFGGDHLSNDDEINQMMEELGLR